MKIDDLEKGTGWGRGDKGSKWIQPKHISLKLSTVGMQ